MGALKYGERALPLLTETAYKPVAATRGIRMPWIDVVRLISAIGIIIAHISLRVFQHVNDLESVHWWVGNIQLSLLDWCTGVFIMMSGLLLLNPSKDEPVVVFYKKRATKILIPVIFWTIFYTFWNLGLSTINGNPTSINYLIKLLVMGRPYYHMGFFYMIIGLYLCTPFIRKIVRQSSDKELMFLCIALFAVSMFATANLYYLEVVYLSDIVDFPLYIAYFIAGYLIARLRSVPRPATLLAIIVFLAALTAAGNYYFLKNGMEMIFHPYFFDALSITAVPMSVCFMLLMKSASTSFNKAGFSGRWAAMSLGILLIHPIFIDILRMLGIRATTFNAFLYIPLMSVTVCTLSFLVVMALNKIPLLKRII